MASKNKTVCLHLLDNCNLNCKHCYLGPPSRRNHTLSWQKVEKALAHFHKQGFEKISFCGGEAYFSPHLKKAVKLANEIGFKEISVGSNGCYPQLVDLFSPKEISYFKFSLDGARPESNDTIRGQGHFGKCLATIKKALAAGHEVRVSSCVTSQNVSEVKELAKLLDGLGVTRLKLIFTSFIGNAIHHPEIVLSPKQWLEAREEVKKIIGLKKLKISMPRMFASKDEYHKLAKSEEGCLLKEAKPSSANVFSSGLIFTCSLITEAEELASHILTNKGVIPQNDWKTLLMERYPSSTCPALDFLRDKYHAIKEEDNLIPVCPYLE